MTFLSLAPGVLSSLLKSLTWPEFAPCSAWSSSVHVFDWPEPKAYLAVLMKDVQETFLCIFYSIFMMKKCNSASKREGFVIIPEQFPWNRQPRSRKWVHRDQRYAEDATARARRKTPMLGGPAKSEQSANAPQCLGAPRSSTRRGPFVDANPIRGRPQIMAGPRPGSWRYRGARHRSLGHDNVWYRVAAGGRLGRQGVGAPTRTRVRPCLQRGPEPNLTPTLQTSARVLMPHRQQQTTPSSHQAQGRMAGLIGKDEYQ